MMEAGHMVLDIHVDLRESTIQSTARHFPEQKRHHTTMMMVGLMTELKSRERIWSNYQHWEVLRGQK